MSSRRPEAAQVRRRLERRRPPQELAQPPVRAQRQPLARVRIAAAGSRWR
jgi:hypothetical protein